MRSRFSRVESFLRASLLALLVLGLMIRPALSGLSELHAVEHASALEQHADDHGHPHDRMPDAHPDDTSPPEDHGSGLHGLMHQPCGHATLGLAVSIELPSASRLTENPPDRVRSGRPQPPPSTLFRPPIA